MATGMAAGAKHPLDLEMRWNFGDSRSTSHSLDEFLAQKEGADGVEFFAPGKHRTHRRCTRYGRSFRAMAKLKGSK
jgi:hypothetical protein